jgi:hypothetical protein
MIAAMARRSSVGSDGQASATTRRPGSGAAGPCGELRVLAGPVVAQVAFVSGSCVGALGAFESPSLRHPSLFELRMARPSPEDEGTTFAAGTSQRRMPCEASAKQGLPSRIPSLVELLTARPPPEAQNARIDRTESLGVLRAEAELDDWAALAFFLSPLDTLRGKAPVDLLLAGDAKRVIALAEAHVA